MMREDNYQRVLKSKGCLASIATTQGRRRVEQSVRSSQLLDDFIRDETKILQSRAFRRLSRKAQIITPPQNSNVRNRATHTFEVVSVAVRIAEYLGLNVNLVRAMALGHDIGHVPFGHQGESYIAKKYEVEHVNASINHRVLGIVIAQHIERDGQGLNLTMETLEGMYYHSGPDVFKSKTPEAKVIYYADRIANLFSDVNDVARLGYVISPELNSLVSAFGAKQRECVDTAVSALCEESMQKGSVSFETHRIAQLFFETERMMYEVYPRIAPQDVRVFLDPIYDFFAKSKIHPVLAISLLTDEDVLFLYTQKNISMEDIERTSLHENISTITDLHVDISNPDLNW